MGQISIEYVVSFSSQDDKYKVNNLISNAGFRKWLTSPLDKSGQAEVTLQLKKAVNISYIDLGTIWCATVEIQVGRSEWPLNQEYVTLVPTSSVMTPQDCRSEGSFNKTRMFGSADFASDIVKQKWDRLKIICRQPFRRNVQMGISFVCIKTSGNEDIASPDSKLTTPKSVKSIQKHFFGKISSSEGKTQELKSRLMKIAGSGEDGVSQEQCLNRNAKLVLAASGSVNKFSVPPKIKSPEGKAKLYSMHLAQQMAPQFEEDALSFLDNYEFKREELDKITIADIRHKFEKKIKRKLTADEKKLFIKLSSDYICEIFMSKEAETETGSSGTKNSEGDSNINNMKANTSATQKKDSACEELGNSHSKAQKLPTGLSYKKVRNMDSLSTPPVREKARTFVSKSVCSRPVNPLPPSPTEDQWLSCTTPPSNGKRKRNSSDSDKKLNRGAKRQQLEEEERNWLGIEGVENGWVSTAARPGDPAGRGHKTGREQPGKIDSKKKGRSNQSSSEGSDSKQAGKDKECPITGPEDQVYEEYSLDSPPAFVECPICSQMFPQGTIEVHAAVCLDSISC